MTVNTSGLWEPAQLNSEEARLERGGNGHCSRGVLIGLFEEGDVQARDLERAGFPGPQLREVYLAPCRPANSVRCSSFLARDRHTQLRRALLLNDCGPVITIYRQSPIAGCPGTAVT